MTRHVFLATAGVAAALWLGAFAAQAQERSRPLAGSQLAQKSCNEVCKEQFQNCTPASSKNLDACRATWQACDAKCPQPTR